MMEEAFAAGTPVAGYERRVLVDRNGDGELEEGFFTYSFLPTSHDDGTVRGLVVHVVETTVPARRRQAAEAAAAASEERYHRAQDVVLSLQRSLLPEGVPILPELRLAAHYLVAGDGNAAGGDWFDAVPLPDRRVVLMVGDVTGHGAAAAGAMGRLRAVALDALDRGLDLGATVARLHRFAALAPATRAATLCLAALDPRTGELTVASHAHPAPLLVGPSDRLRFVPVEPAQPLGTGGPPAAVHRTGVGPDDLLLLYTDGLVERPGRPLDATLGALAQVAAAARQDEAPTSTLPEPLADRVATLVVERLGFLATGYRDDVTLLVAHRHPSWRV